MRVGECCGWFSVGDRGGVRRRTILYLLLRYIDSWAPILTAFSPFREFKHNLTHHLGSLTQSAWCYLPGAQSNGYLQRVLLGAQAMLTGMLLLSPSTVFSARFLVPKPAENQNPQPPLPF